MVLSELMNDTLDFSATFFQMVLFLFIGGIFALYVTSLGQKVASFIFKNDLKSPRVSFNPLRQLTFFNLFSIVFYIIFGGGWSVSPDKTENRGKDIAVALSGPLFCVIAAIASLAAYNYSDIALLRALLLALASSFIAFSFINILPLPGLCGGNIISALLSEKMALVFDGWRKYSLFFVTAVAALLCRSGVMDKVIGFAVGNLLSLFA